MTILRQEAERARARTAWLVAAAAAVLSGIMLAALLFGLKQRNVARENAQAANEAREATAQANERVVTRFAEGDLATANLHLRAGGDTAQGIAYLTRSLRTKPDFSDASTRLAEVLTKRTWFYPTTALSSENSEHLKCTFFEDGHGLLRTGEYSWSYVDSESGRIISGPGPLTDGSAKKR